MNKKISKIIKTQKFKFRERHVRWNWEKSPASTEDRKFVRYHFVVVDDRFRENKLIQIISNFQNKTIMNYPFDEVRKVEGKFANTNFRYLFVSYDTEYSPKLLNFKKVSENIKRDSDLKERKIGSIESYISKLYE